MDSNPQLSSASGLNGLRLATLLFALGQIWTSRFSVNPDGIAYLDIARAWLRGDWAGALNTYWSPLYSWLVAAVFALFRPGIRWQYFTMHAINFAGFAAALLAWDHLFKEWEKWQGPPKHRKLVNLAACATICWVGLHLVGLAFDSADILVLALTLLLAARLVRVRSGAARPPDFAVIGVVLGTAFLAKSATMVMIPVTFAVLAGLLRSITDKRIGIALVTTLAVVAPFITALSLASHRFTFGDTGPINYSMIVGGLSAEGYKDSVLPPPDGVPHAPRIRLSDPRVLSFEAHATGTFPIHNDPAWWYRGYPVLFNAARQAEAIRGGIAFVLLLVLCMPASALFLFCFRSWKKLGQLWFLGVPAVASLATYCLVIVHARYIAGPLALIGFILLAALWQTDLSRRAERVAAVSVVLLFGILTWRELVTVPFYVAGEMLAWGSSPLKANVDLAENMTRKGLRPGDGVAFIGDTLDATWLGLNEARIVAMVPARIYHSDTELGRPIQESFEKTDRFWRSGALKQGAALAAFRDAGAKWALANEVPPGADLTDWMIAGPAQKLRDADSGYLYYRRLQ